MTKKVGGKRQEIMASMDIKFTPGKVKKVGQVPVYTGIGFTIEKHKYGTPKGRGEFTMYFTDYKGFQKGEIDNITPLIVYAKRTGVLEKEGRKLRFGDLTFSSAAELFEFLRNPENSEVFDIMWQATVRMYRDNPLGTQDETEGEADDV